MSILSANTSPKLQEERKAAENAQAILRTLTPSRARSDRAIFVLRYAANLAKTRTLARLESRQALDGLRIEAATALNEVCRLLDRGPLPQDAIDQATKRLWRGWKRCLPEADAAKRLFSRHTVQLSAERKRATVRRALMSAIL
jgi:hypothetical protein